METAMSTTLARKIRRIGLDRTTYRETEERVLAKNDEGKMVEEIRVKRTPQHNRLPLTIEELTAKREQTIAEWRAKRKRRK